MNLHAAQAFLLQDQRNWRKPHLAWLPSALYRYKSFPTILAGRHK